MKEEWMLGTKTDGYAVKTIVSIESVVNQGSWGAIGVSILW